MSQSPLIIRLKRGAGKQVKKGSPWVFAGDIVPSSEQMLADDGSLAQLQDHKGRVMGMGYFNAKAQLAFRRLAPTVQTIDEAFFAERLQDALALRHAEFKEPYYRLVNAEADGLPGLVVDRFNDIYVLQIATAGMERLMPAFLAALSAVLAPKAVVLRNDFHARTLEGLKQEVKVLYGDVPPWVEVRENGCTYYADLINGQKTGWFYDQRDNRAAIAERAQDKSVLDLYCNAGGFGVLAAKHGARRVTLVDSSALAIELGREAARKNEVQDLCTFRKADARETMDALAASKLRYDIVVIDPPAFVKRKQDIEPGLKAYTALAREAAMLVEDAGILMIASCSHHAARPRFREAVLKGVKEAGRIGNVLAYTGHAADHPMHPQLPQSEYLKALMVRCHYSYEAPVPAEELA